MSTPLELITSPEPPSLESMEVLRQQRIKMQRRAITIAFIPVIISMHLYASDESYYLYFLASLGFSLVISCLSGYYIRQYQLPSALHDLLQAHLRGGARLRGNRAHIIKDRVKCVDFHPTKPWVLVAKYNGTVTIWDSESGYNIHTFNVSDLPVRCAKFIERKQWFVTAGDDMKLRVYDYNTMEKIYVIEEAHPDYIRSLDVHPTIPLILTGSDDMTIKSWNWEHGFDKNRVQLFEGHAHYVMAVKINPRDPNIFASASLDRSIKIWGLQSRETLRCTLTTGQELGINCIDFHPSKPHILSGADRGTMKIWDYQTASLVHSLVGHAHNVSAVIFHPVLPLICSTAEDDTVKLWHNVSYCKEETLKFGAGRGWTLAASKKGMNEVAIGFDDGCVLIDIGLGSSSDIESMDTSLVTYGMKGRSLWFGRKVETTEDAII